MQELKKYARTLVLHEGNVRVSWCESRHLAHLDQRKKYAGKQSRS